MAEIRKEMRVMGARYGARSSAHHLVGVVAYPVTPGAIRIRRDCGARASMRSLAGVDATGNRRPDVYTSDMSEFSATNAWKQNFNNGNQNNNNKNYNYSVRAVRK